MKLVTKLAMALPLLALAALVTHPSRAEQPLRSIEAVIKDARTGVDFIGNDELIKRIHANPKLVLLDVRTHEEYQAGHMKGATWMERGIAEFRLARTLRDPNAEIVVYCALGNRSALVVKALKRMGYRNVRSHVGFNQWLEAGHPFSNMLGEAKLVKLRKLNSAMEPVDYYSDKR